jgi:hypothetical protein
VSSLPENPAAVRTEGKTPGFFVDKRGDKIAGISPAQPFQTDITMKAATEGINLCPEIQILQNLAHLLSPVLAFNEKATASIKPFQQGMVPGQKKTPFPAGKFQQVTIVSPGKIKGIKAQDFKPFSQLS